MPIIPFLFGLLLGLGFCWWRQYRVNQQLRWMLISLSDGRAEIAALPSLSLVRRELVRLNQENQQLRLELKTGDQLLAIAPIAYLKIDQDNQLLWCNEQAQQLLQIYRWQPGQVRLLLELVRSYELDQLIEKTRKLQQNQVQEWLFYPSSYSIYEQEVNGAKNVTSQQDALTLKGYAFPLPQEQVGVFLINQQPLVELKQTRDRALSDLTHELRTPLTAIRLVAEALEKRLEGSEKRWVQQMLNEVNRLFQLVQDWLELSQLQANPSQNLQYQSVELKSLILAVWQTLQPLADKKELELSYLGDAECYLQADQARLTQVLLNILDNGIKHSPSQGIITVKLNSNQTEISIKITDTGSGFAERDLPYVFERLYRGDRSRARIESDIPNQGSGLGLAIAKEIIEAHGGTITAYNDPDTGGASLEIILSK